MTQAWNLSQLANKVNTSGQLDVSTGATGLLPIANGSTGLISSGASGNVLTSNGTSWVSQAPSGGSFSGATTTTSAVDITLTNSSTQTQIITMSASGKSIILPDATTLSTKGGIIYNIINNGNVDFLIKSNGGNILGVLYSSSSAILFLTANTTAAGIWQLNVSSTPIIPSAYYQGLQATSTSIGSLRNSNWGYRGFAVLSTSLIVYYYVDSSLAGWCVAGSISAGVITFGTPVKISTTALTENGTTFGFITRVNATTALVLATIGGNNSYVAMTISGNTITMGTPSTVGSSSLPNSWLLNPADGLVVGCGSFTTGNVQIRAATVSGTTITLGAAVNLTSVGSSSHSYGAGVIDSARIILEDAGKARIATISGTTLTLGTASTGSLNNTVAGCFLFTAVSSTNCYLGQSLITYGSTGTVISAVTGVSYSSFGYNNGGAYGGAVQTVLNSGKNWASNALGAVEYFNVTSASFTNGFPASASFFPNYSYTDLQQPFQNYDSTNIIVCGFNSSSFLTFSLVKVG